LGRRSDRWLENSFIATLVERRTRYVMLAKVSGKEMQTVVAALAAQVQHLPRDLRRMLT
jgi:IS30 family transposase